MPATLRSFSLALLQQFVSQVHPRGAMAWENGVGRLAAGLVDAAGVPEVTGDDIAVGALNLLGIGPAPRRGALHRPVAGRIASQESAAGPVIDVQGEWVR